MTGEWVLSGPRPSPTRSDRMHWTASGRSGSVQFVTDVWSWLDEPRTTAVRIDGVSLAEVRGEHSHEMAAARVIDALGTAARGLG